MIGLFRYPVFAEDPAPRANKVLSLLFIAGTAVLIAGALFLAGLRNHGGGEEPQVKACVPFVMRSRA